MAARIDEVDRRLLALLQTDARCPATELADRIGVSDNTVHNRMQRLEEDGIIERYRAVCGYEAVGFRLHYLFVATVRIVDRGTVATQALEIPQVFEVTELMTGRDNLHIKAVGVDKDDITQVAEQLDNLELEIVDEHLIKAQHEKPLDFDELEPLLGE